MRPVYLDHNATTPVAPQVLRAMDPYLKGQFGNPLTAHRFGEGPAGALAEARRCLRALFGAGTDFRVVFNSGASEGLNTALKGIAFASLVDGCPGTRRRIVIGGLEHYAVEQPAAWLAGRLGFEVVTVAPGRNGVVAAHAFLEAVDGGARGDTTVLAALHWANNEVGSVQPVQDVGAGCRDLGVPFVCDAVQAVGKLDTSVGATTADVIAVSAHKFYGPKGAGALLVREGVVLDPLLHGAKQEGGLRAGTHNVPGIVGLSAAAEIARTGWRSAAARLGQLRDAFREQVHGRLDRVHWNGHAAPLLPNTINLSFEGCPSDALCVEMDRRGFAISAGAACDAGRARPSKNLLAMGLSESRALTSVRISLGHDTSAHDMTATADALAAAVRKVRATV